MYYDLHIHSALSPCGDNDMTPNNIVNMAVLKGLDTIALTDHNSCKNCPALWAAAQASGLKVLCGMEINTAEEIHAVCLFPTPEQAMAFDAYVYARLPDVPNDPAIFGEQRILDAQDCIIGYEPKLLINACEISIMELTGLMEQFGGICFPAHIEKTSYSITSSLGMVPPECGFTLYEVKDRRKLPQMLPLLPCSAPPLIVHNSDAHYLWEISEAENELPCNDLWAYFLSTKI
ncbi:PHP domain-containing protein [Hydrogenoanaerobacterium sp.]|uniref:PHP domain-containing protein n=1 Tax=Hydrogenoanaerobacterium sp. TaxID=2953763 RepID=UPI00289DA9BC|nr:PHP domain-containing protein [Hydrogenoanaerobacterium sp.]